MTTVSNNPIRGWSASGVVRAGDGGTSGPHLQIQFQDELGVKRAGEYTVQFAVMLPDGSNVPNPLAEVLWKTQGNIVRRVVSVIDGTSISGVAEAVSVKVTDNSEAITGFDYQVAILLTPGTRASNVVPPVYIPIQAAGYPGRYVVPSGTDRTIPIPQNAGITSVFVTASVLGPPPIPLTEATCWVYMQTGGGGPVLLKQYDPRFAGWVPVPPSAASLVLNNASGANVVYGVAFGVDG